MSTNKFPHPQYDAVWNLTLDTTGKDPEAMKKLREVMWSYELPEGMEMYDDVVPASGTVKEVPIRVYRYKDLPANSPMILNIHGGGFTTGTRDNDNARCIAIADMTPCIVVSVEYTLVPEAVYPTQILECLSVLNWMYDNAEKLGGDKDRIGLHGTSAGGNLAAGLALYVRDYGGPKITVVGLNVPATDNKVQMSAFQNWDSPILKGENLMKNGISAYAGDQGGRTAPYYVHPNLCENLSGFPATIVITAEYDPLRDDSISFALHLLRCAVPCELYVMPRVPHGFDILDAPMTKWIRRGMCDSFRREFDRVAK